MSDSLYERKADKERASERDFVINIFVPRYYENTRNNCCC